MGISRKAAVVDVLVNTVGANPSAARECFDTISYCRKELDCQRSGGLSNISFGMPQRAFVNTAFLNVALSKGLNMAIANPSQEMLMYSALAVDMLLEKPGASERYLESVPQAPDTYRKRRERKGCWCGYRPERCRSNRSEEVSRRRRA